MQELAALRDTGRSVVMVLHEVNHAAAWADHVVAMKAGRIAAEEPPDAVFTPGVLEPLYDMPLKVERYERAARWCCTICRAGRYSGCLPRPVWRWCLRHVVQVPLNRSGPSVPASARPPSAGTSRPPAGAGLLGSR